MSRFDKFLVPPEDREIVVEHKGEKFVFRGKPDAAIMGRAMLPPVQLASRVTLYHAESGAKTPTDHVANVILIAAYLRQEPGDNITEAKIALLRETDFALYTKFNQAAMDLCGLSEMVVNAETKQEEPAAPLVVAGLGNSPEAPLSGPESLEPYSPQPGITQTI